MPLAGYSGTPLVKKLGIEPGDLVDLHYMLGVVTSITRPPADVP